MTAPGDRVIVGRPGMTATRHSDPHFGATGLCLCHCPECTAKYGCVCPDCTCRVVRLDA